MDSERVSAATLVVASFFTPLRYGDPQEQSEEAGSAAKATQTILHRKGKMMKKWFLVCLIFVTQWALADSRGGFTLEKRQPDKSMTVTLA